MNSSQFEIPVVYLAMELDGSMATWEAVMHSAASLVAATTSPATATMQQKLVAPIPGFGAGQHTSILPSLSKLSQLRSFAFSLLDVPKDCMGLHASTLAQA